MAAALKLGLIGGNIAQSKAPTLHRLAGVQTGMAVEYNRLVPETLNTDFDGVFDLCSRENYRGINVTYPFKELAAQKVSIQDPLVQAIGAVNTVIFEKDGPVGFNTDYSGFVAAYKAKLGDTPLGNCCLIGCGGVGRALAFALISLQADTITLVDTDPTKAQSLANDLGNYAPDTKITTAENANDACIGADGIVNGTPIGMVGNAGTPVQASAFNGTRWAFDAVYTPVNTQFLSDAEAAGVSVISGYELFFHQGVHAWQLFSGTPLDEARLRSDLLLSEAA